MTPSSYYKWIALGLGVLLLSCLALFFISWRPDWPKPLVGPIWDLGHVAVFAIWASVLALCLHAKPRLPSYTFIVVCLLLLGAGIEWLQPLFARQAQWQDVAYDGLGVVLGLLFYDVMRVYRGKFRLVFAALLLCLAVYLLLPLAQAVYSLQHQQRLLPLLWQGQYSSELPVRFGGSAAKALNADGLEVEFGTTRYSTLAIDNLPRDWRGYDRLAIELEALEAFKLSCRIHDRAHEIGPRPYRYHDRYSQGFTLKPGRQQLEIDLARVERAPQKRQMQMGQIRKLICFSYQLKQPRKVVLYSIKFTSKD